MPENGAILTALRSTDTVFVDGRDWSGDWLHVISAGQQGWMSSQYVRLTESPIFPLPLHRSMRINEFYLILVPLLGIALLADRRKEPMDVFWITVALILSVVIPVQPSAWAAQSQIIISILLVLYACKDEDSWGFDLTPMYMFTGISALAIVVTRIPGNFAFLGSGAGTLMATLAVGFAVAEQIRQRCRIGLMLSGAIAVPTIVLSFTGASPLILASSIFAASVLLPSWAMRRSDQHAWMECEDWLQLGESNYYFAPDVAGLTLMLMLLLSI